MKVAVVYHFFAHYRGPVIGELRGSEQFEFVFISGTKVNSPYSSLKLFDFDQADDHLLLENRWFLKHFLWQKGLLCVLSQGHFDAVIFLGDWKFISTWIAVAFLKFKGIPTLFWSHGLRSRPSSLNNRLKLIFLSLFSHGGFVYDNLAKDVMRREGFSKPLSVIYNSLDYSYQQRVLAKIRRDPVASLHRPYIVFSGRIESRKRLDQLINAIGLLKRKNVEIDAVIIGDGPTKPQLINLSRQLKVLDNVKFIGSCYDEELLCKYFYSSIACIVPSAVGLTAIHALTYGTPVITNDDYDSHGPEVEAVKAGVSGFFYEKNNEASLAAVIEHILSLSASQRAQLKSSCEEIIRRNFTPENQLQTIKLHLSSIFNVKQD